MQVSRCVGVQVSASRFRHRSPEKMGRQLVSFALGVAVGLCLYLLPKPWPLGQGPLSPVSPTASANHPARSHFSPLAKRSRRTATAAPEGANSEEPVHAWTPKVPRRRARTQTEPAALKVTESPAAEEPAVVKVSSAPPAPITFKPMGYVEKAGGQLEAIISQEKDVQVVHIDDLISGRYRVTKITPDSVEALDETQVQSPMAKPNGAESKELTAEVAPQPSTPPVGIATGPQRVLAAAATSPPGPPAEGREAAPEVAQVLPSLPPRPARQERISPSDGPEPVAGALGYVEEANGTTETVVSDGDTVRLVPAAPMATLARNFPLLSPEAPQDLPPPAPASVSRGVADAESAVYPSQSSAVPVASVVREVSYQFPIPTPGAAGGSAPHRPEVGSVSAEAKSANPETDPTSFLFTEDFAGQTDPPAQPPVLMTPIGFVVKEDGEFAAILSDSDGVYIVQQGDRFAGRFRALSVTADAVEAVEDPPPRQAHPPPLVFSDLLSAAAQPERFLFAQEDCQGCRSSDLGEVSERVPEDPPKEAETPPPRDGSDTRVKIKSIQSVRQRSALPGKKTASSLEVPAYVFQTLGHVVTQDGVTRAIVAVGKCIW